MRGCDKPSATLSKTEHYNLGQNNLSFGKGALNSINVFNVGSDPGYFGSVFIFSKLVQYYDGTILIRLNWMNAFFTGSIPVDCKPLNPRIFIETLNSYISTFLSKWVFSFNAGLKT